MGECWPAERWGRRAWTLSVILESLESRHPVDRIPSEQAGAFIGHCLELNELGRDYLARLLTAILSDWKTMDWSGATLLPSLAAAVVCGPDLNGGSDRLCRLIEDPSVVGCLNWGERAAVLEFLRLPCWESRLRKADGTSFWANSFAYLASLIGAEPTTEIPGMSPLVADHLLRVVTAAFPVCGIHLPYSAPDWSIAVMAQIWALERNELASMIGCRTWLELEPPILYYASGGYAGGFSVELRRWLHPAFLTAGARFGDSTCADAAVAGVPMLSAHLSLPERGATWFALSSMSSDLAGSPADKARIQSALQAILEVEHPRTA